MKMQELSDEHLVELDRACQSIV